MVAALFGGWLIFKYYAARGPEVTVRFETAEGVIAGKTPVLCRSVNIGTVEKVQLTDKLRVLVTLQMTSDATDLLVKDTQIWVVRPRYGGAGLSGLSTIVSGNYIELEPGLSKEERSDFIGLEQPPVTPKGVPGLHIKLIAESAGGIDPGSPITYKGLEVGKIEKRTFLAERGEVEFDAFVQGEYGKLIRRTTKFWNIGGIDLEVGANGVRLRTGTLEALLLGGITFNEPPEDAPQKQVADGTVFTLYDSFEDTTKFQMENPLAYLLLFSESVRGLSPDAPVEFRGIRIGAVEGISFRYLPNDPEKRVPVMIRIDPDLITELPPGGYQPALDFIARNVRRACAPVSNPAISSQARCSSTSTSRRTPSQRRWKISAVTKSCRPVWAAGWLRCRNRPRRCSPNCRHFLWKRRLTTPPTPSLRSKPRRMI